MFIHFVYTGGVGWLGFLRALGFGLFLKVFEVKC